MKKQARGMVLSHGWTGVSPGSFLQSPRAAFRA